MRIKDAQVKKDLRWHILRLLRLSSQTRVELVESVGGRLRLTGRGRGREELKWLAEMPVTYVGWTGRKSMNVRKIDSFAEGL